MAELAKKQPLDATGVHRTHCCARHGCKYGEIDTCPVRLVQIKQDHPCYYCESRENLEAELQRLREELRWLEAFENVRPPDMRCGSCDQKLVPQQGGFYLGKLWDPHMWVANYTHAGPMMDRHGAWPVERWEE